MARRGKNESPVSLFSFQDIITSITGIMFLVVLLLILMMLSSRQAKPQDAAAENTQALQKELAVLKEKLQTLRNNQQQLDKQMEELKKLSPEEIELRKEKYQQQLRSEQTKLENITQDIKLKEEQIKQIRNEHIQLKLDEKIKHNQAIIEDLKNKLKKLTEAINEKEKARSQRSRVMKYVVRINSPKRPVLAELDKDGIRFMDLENNKIVDLRQSGNGAESLPRLAMELAKLNSAQIYFSIAVKPGGFKHAIPVMEMLKNNNFERGFEILPDDTSSIFEESKP